MSWQCYLRKGATISDENLKNAWDKNTDGGGFAWAKDGKLFVSNGFFKYEEFLKSFREIGDDCSRTIMFRWANIGRNAENSQPILVNENICFSQSGTLSHFHSKNGKSDSLIYCEEVLIPFLKDDYTKIYREEVKWFLTESGGNYNKFVFLTKDGRGIIINANKGFYDETQEKVWYSNKDHETPKYVYLPNSSSTNTGGSSYTSHDNYFKNVNGGPLRPDETYPIWLKKCFDEALKMIKV